MQANFDRVKGIFGGSSQASTDLRRKFEESAGLAFDDFLRAAHVLFGIFLRSSTFPDYTVHQALGSRFRSDTVAGTLKMLSVTRAGFRKYYNNKVATSTPSGAVYEFNPLLRYPILLREDRFSCAFPELISYVATRGLYFYIADAAGQSFNGAFADAFEAYVTSISSDAYGAENVLTEKQERNLGWTGKTNDVTIIGHGFAMLTECKNSGLFSVSKRSADPTDLAADIRKNLANAEKRKGLFQLHDKIENIRNGQLPTALQAKYSSIQSFYPVLLLHDEIWFANRPETLKNLIDAELAAHGIHNFDYQIWHIEELELLLKAVPKDELGNVLKEKFTDARYKSLDLTAYLSNRFGLPDMGIKLFLPMESRKP